MRGVLAGMLATGAGLVLYSAAATRRAERLVPRDGRLIDLGGHMLHIVEQGSGVPIVMIHGLGGQVRNFAYGVSDALAARHHVVTLDRPGSGYSTALDGDDIGIGAQAGLVATLIQQLGLDRPLLVGHSYGGAVSLAVALARPDLIRGLALIAPLSQRLPPLPPMVVPFSRASLTMRQLSASVIGMPIGQLTQRNMLETAFAPEPVPGDFAVRGGGALSRRPGAIAGAAGDLRTADAELSAMVSRYPAIDLPTAILFGHDDRVLDPSLHGKRTAAAIPNARLRLVEGGHMLPVTQPELTARFIDDAYRSSSG